MGGARRGPSRLSKQFLASFRRGSDHSRTIGRPGSESGHLTRFREGGAPPARRLAPPLHGYSVAMMARGDSRESFIDRALPVYLGLLFAILTVVAVVLLFMVRHVLLVLFVSVLFAAALTGPSEWLHRRSRLPLGPGRGADLHRVLRSHHRPSAGSSCPHCSVRLSSSPTAHRSTPSATRESVRRTPSFGPTFRRYRHSSNSCRDSKSRSSPPARRGAAALPGDVFSIFIDLLAVFFISLLLLTTRLRIRDFVLSLTHPVISVAPASSSTGPGCGSAGTCGRRSS